MGSKDTVKGKVIPFKRPEKVTATGIEVEVDPNLSLEPMDELLYFYCPECESTDFQMVGFCNGTESGEEDHEIVKMVCSECETPIDGAFAWYNESD